LQRLGVLDRAERSGLARLLPPTFNLTQPEMSKRLGRRKMDHIEATGAQMVATGNVGCILQIARKVKERGRPIEVIHPVDLLDRAYRGESAGD
jgi:glycolate oxidase iron-sulfur subunit